MFDKMSGGATEIIMPCLTILACEKAMFGASAIAGEANVAVKALFCQIFLLGISKLNLFGRMCQFSIGVSMILPSLNCG